METKIVLPAPFWWDYLTRGNIGASLTEVMTTHWQENTTQKKVIVKGVVRSNYCLFIFLCCVS